MTDQLLAQLADFGALGIFAAFLVYQHFTMQRKIDGLIDKFQIQLDGIRAECAEQEDKLRDRYDSVIAQYRDEATVLRDGVIRSLEDVARKLEDLLARR